MKKLIRIALRNKVAAIRFGLRRFAYKLIQPMLPDGKACLPETVVFMVTQKCNLHCQMCYAPRNDGSIKELTPIECFFVIDKIKDVSPILSIGGGEPLSQPDIIGIISYAKSSGLICNLATNGTLIDKTMAERLVAVGLDFISVSIDSQHLCGATETELYYSRAVTGMVNLVHARGLNVTPRINVSCHIGLGESLEIPNQLLRMFNTNHTNKWDTLHFYPIHHHLSTSIKGMDEPSPYGITMDKFDPKAIQEMKMFLQRASQIKGVYSCCDCESFFSKESSAPEKCQLIYRSAMIDAYGDLFLCRDTLLGNVKDHTIRELWNGEKARAFRQKRNRTAFVACSKC